jgi:hypothetical protein
LSQRFGIHLLQQVRDGCSFVRRRVLLDLRLAVRAELRLIRDFLSTTPADHVVLSSITD